MKRIKYFSFFIILSFICCACSKQAVSNKKEIEFWTLQLSSFKPFITSVIKEYEQKRPDVKIKWIDVPFSEGEKRALASVMSKKTPDLINLNPSFTTTLASKGALYELNIDKKVYDSYIEESWSACSYNKGLYGIPWYMTSAITIYNKEILDKADIKSIPKTYDDIEKLAKQIKDKTGKYVLMPALCEDGKIIKLFNKYDIPITDKKADKAVFNTKEAADILNFWQKLYSDNLIPPESITQGHRQALEKYQSGETAFIVVGANFLKIIKENAPQIYSVSDINTQLTGSNDKVDFSLMNLVVPKRSKNKEIAIDFGLFITNAQNQLEFCKLAPVLPSTKKTLNSNLFKNQNNDLLLKARYISANQLKMALKPVQSIKNQKELYETADFMTQTVLLKKQTSQDALDTTVQKWNEILK